MKRLHVLLAAALLLGIWVWSAPPPPSPDDVVQAQARDDVRAPEAAPATPSASSASAGPRALADRLALYPWPPVRRVERDLFASTRPPAPPAMPSEPATDSQAPPFPFAYAGKQRVGGAWEVFLTRDELTLVLKEGVVFEQSYQVVRIAPPLLTVLHVPTSQRYSVPIGENE